MAIKTGKAYKVYEQDTGNEGCGAVLASFSVNLAGSDAVALASANERAARYARENPGTRYYVLASVSARYQDDTGGIVQRTY